MEELLELVPRDRNRAFYFYLPLMLLPAEVDSILEKGGSKRNSVGPGGSARDKMVFALLIEVITLHVRPTALDVRGLGLELVSRSSI